MFISWRASRRKQPWAWLIGWLALVSVAVAALYSYSFTAGQPATAPTLWPQDVKLARAEHTLVMIVHPHCSCTRASVAELARLMLRLPDTVRVHVLFAVPERMAPGWERTDLWASVALVPRVKVHVDYGRRLAARFGARTSGEVLLYASNDELVFAGGITPTRGHQGNSVGYQRIIKLVEQGVAERAVSDVFGCSLYEDDSGERSAPDTEARLPLGTM